MSNYIKIILLIFFQEIYLAPICEERKNNCAKCNYINNLCIKCDKEIYIPDENGGCQGAKKCFMGKNYCSECSEVGNICQKCEVGYFPDENGGCSYTDNCQISYKGKCLKCKEEFILTGINKDNNYLICKSLNSEDFKNCDNIDINKGTCSKCKEGYYLNKGDNRCISIENCLESSFGKCTQCIDGYYLSKKNNICLKQEGLFIHCKESTDDELCDLCEDNYYLSQDGKCSETNFCSQVDNSKCVECISDYFLSKFYHYCSSTDNCYMSDQDTGLCFSCMNDYYLDYKDGKCKSNKEDNEFKYCRNANEVCKDCIYPYILGEDSKCSLSKNCANSELGKCISCLDNYFLGKDNKCSNVQHCIYSNIFYECIECEDKYYYDANKNICSLAEKNFENCKISDYNGNLCEKCKEGFYLNLKDHLCYSNKELGNFYGCSETDKNGEYCSICINGFYFGQKYKRCSKIQGCEMLLDENNCQECNEKYVLDKKSGKCEINYEIIDIQKKFYFKCNETNEEGTQCESCVNGVRLDDNGLCFDDAHCIKGKNGICQKCGRKENEYLDYCLNSDFGCVETLITNCLECDDILDLNKCTKCFEGYELDSNNKCVKI